MSDDKELWIDLHTLVPSSTDRSGFLHIFIEYSDKCPRPYSDPIIFNLRIALRALGFKITRIVNTMKSDGTDVMVKVETNVPSDLYKKSISIYNDWIGSVGEDEYADSGCGCDCHCDSHSDSDSDNSDDPTAV